jgi:hypothetical protein
MFLNRSRLGRLLEYGENPNALIPKPKEVKKAVIEDDETTPKEVFLSIIKDLNKLTKDGKKKNVTKKSKKKVIRKLTEFFKEQFPLVDEKEEDCFD